MALLAIVVALCIHNFDYERTIRLVHVISVGEQWVGVLGGVLKALILMICMILMGLRVMIPLFEMAAMYPWGAHGHGQRQA